MLSSGCFWIVDVKRTMIWRKGSIDYYSDDVAQSLGSMIQLWDYFQILVNLSQDTHGDDDGGLEQKASEYKSLLPSFREMYQRNNIANHHVLSPNQQPPAIQAANHARNPMERPAL